ncbi:MAG: CBS domain-containing protein [Bacteroidetes bacterium]|nr:CBS domain-containing protein [Bacteroidota bacterium]
MKISASVYSNKTKNLLELVRELDTHKVDYFHIDCNDSPLVFDDIKKIKEASTTPIDLHIISNNPEQYFEKVKQLKVELLTIQYENLPKHIDLSGFESTKLGLAITSNTSITAFDEYASFCDFILFMTTTPGQSGGEFNRENFKKIREFKLKYPDKKIHVDGGVNADISFILRNMGVYSSVSGSYLVNADVIGGALHNMRNSNYIPNTLHVSDMMMPISELPVLNITDASFVNILKSIDKYNLGFTLIVGENKFEGLISNADVRKALIKKINNVNSIDVNDLLNKNPIKVYDDFSISDMIEFIKNTKNNILYLPVVDRKERLSGAITFTNLIKGE